MLTAAEPSLQPARYYHLAVLSECDADCTLCATLGCLRPAKITSPEFRQELELAQRNLKTAVVFPPNFLHHPEAAQFITESVERGFNAIVRLRPEQLVTFSELIATLEYRGAHFEVVVSQPVSEKVLKRQSGRALPRFKTVFVPTADYDPRLLLESIPLTWRQDLEVLAPLPIIQKSALSPDQVFLFLRSVSRDVRLKPYSELDRRPRGFIPGAATAADPVRFSFRALGANDENIRLTLVFAVSNATDIAALERRLVSLKTQTLARQKFEVILAFDRVGDEYVERLCTWSRESGLTVRGLELEPSWGETSLRASRAWNLAASHARGTALVFLDEMVPDVELLNQLLREITTHGLVKISGGSAGAASFGVTLQHYFALGGFAEALQDAPCSVDFFFWKSIRQGINPQELTLARTTDGTTETSRRRRDAVSAQQFYLCTLSDDVYRAHYTAMGFGFALRRTFEIICKSALVQNITSGVSHLRQAINRQRFAAHFASKQQLPKAIQ